MAKHAEQHIMAAEDAKEHRRTSGDQIQIQLPDYHHPSLQAPTTMSGVIGGTGAVVSHAKILNPSATKTAFQVLEISPFVPEKSVALGADGASGCAGDDQTADKVAAQNREHVERHRLSLEASITKGFLSQLEELDVKEEVVQGPTRFTEAKWFNGFISFSIFVNTIQMGVEVDQEVQFMLLDHILTAIFFMEMLCKLSTERCAYFKSGWNWLDFFLVTIAVVDVWIIGVLLSGESAGLNVSYLRVLKILKVVRMVRLLKVFKELWLIIQGIVSSVKTILWVSLLLGMILYVCAIFTCQTIGRSDSYGDLKELRANVEAGEEGDIVDFNNHQFFGSIPRAMFTLFNIALFSGDWDEVGRATIERQPWMFPFLLGFIMFTTFGLMNVIIGVIVDNTMECSQATKEDVAREEQMEHLEKLRTVVDVLFKLDTDGNGYISEEEFGQGLRQKEVRDRLAYLNMPHGCDARELFLLLDQDGDGQIRSDEFMKSVFRLLDANPERQAISLQIAVSRCIQMVQGLDTRLARMEETTTGAVAPQQQKGSAGAFAATNTTMTTTTNLPSFGRGGSGEISASLGGNILLRPMTPATTPVLKSKTPPLPPVAPAVLAGSAAAAAGQQQQQGGPRTTNPVAPAALEQILTELLRGQEALRQEITEQRFGMRNLRESVRDLAEGQKRLEERPGPAPFSPTFQQVVLTDGRAMMMEPGVKVLSGETQKLPLPQLADHHQKEKRAQDLSKTGTTSCPVVDFFFKPATCNGMTIPPLRQEKRNPIPPGTTPAGPPTSTQQDRNLLCGGGTGAPRIFEEENVVFSSTLRSPSSPDINGDFGVGDPIMEPGMIQQAVELHYACGTSRQHQLQSYPATTARESCCGGGSEGEAYSL